MKSKFAHTLDLVRANLGFEGFGFKRAALEANAERTMMRFALEAYRNPALAAAIDAGTIADPRIVQIFHRLPSPAIRIVCSLETRLQRRLSRSRAEKLVAAFLKISGKPICTHQRSAAGKPEKSAVAKGLRRLPMPDLPAIF